MDTIDMQDQIAIADDQLAFLTKAFSYGIEVNENESRGVSHFLTSVRNALPQESKPADVLKIAASK